ncbi:hypothetical protein, partial [Devosia sp.]|uniref:hypothetical protein n=1 Tax=Devosia sp. TaxID=1871048 RepID=UPI0037C0717B
ADKITSFFDRTPKTLAKPNTSNRRKTPANRGVPDFFTTDHLPRSLAWIVGAALLVAVQLNS